MKNTLVVVADLGCFKAFRLENHHPHHTPRLEPVEEFNNADAHGKLGDKVSDLSGRFPRSRGRRTRREPCRTASVIISSWNRASAWCASLRSSSTRWREAKDVERCLLAASREINHQLLDELEPQVRAKIEKNIPADLTKLERAEIMRHF